MVNTEKIKERMDEKGKKIKHLARKAKCTPYSMGRKLTNKAPLNLDETQVLCDELDITTLEFPEFFLQRKLQNATE